MKDTMNAGAAMDYGTATGRTAQIKIGRRLYSFAEFVESAGHRAWEMREARTGKRVDVVVHCEGHLWMAQDVARAFREPVFFTDRSGELRLDA